MTSRTVEDGREAIELLDTTTERFDVILMDWQMPHVDGLEATRTLRRRGLETPIIALTAAAMHGDRDRCLAAGCDRYLVKPIEFRSLYRALAEFLPPAFESTAAPDVDSPAGAADAIERLSQRYLERLPSSIDELEAALQRRDWDELDGRVHKLVGTSGSYGLSEILAIAEELETAAAERQAEPAERRVEELRDAVERRRSTEGETL